MRLKNIAYKNYPILRTNKDLIISINLSLRTIHNKFCLGKIYYSLFFVILRGQRRSCEETSLCLHEGLTIKQTHYSKKVSGP